MMGMPMQLSNIELDDGFSLSSNTVRFFTPEYNLELKSTSKENILQLYIPRERNAIAIEPMIGAADGFNNKIGLQDLRPNASYNVVWDLIIDPITIKTN